MTLVPASFRHWRAALRFDEISLGFGGVRLATLVELEAFQIGYSMSLDGTNLCSDAPGYWRSTWLAIGEETSGGDPLILDTSSKALAVLTARHGLGQWDPYPVATSLAALDAALNVLAQTSRGRENPVALERNPMTEEERELALSVIGAANPGIDLQYWDLLLTRDDA
ncbi:hypothetical protein O4H66_02240 [Comamonadaceae bacterium G21597-S1]|nr:hypothetical protein [Comamonadaceae bacterium G21597-S1]